MLESEDILDQGGARVSRAPLICYCLVFIITGFLTLHYNFLGGAKEYPTIRDNPEAKFSSGRGGSYVSPEADIWCQYGFIIEFDNILILTVVLCASQTASFEYVNVSVKRKRCTQQIFRCFIFGFIPDRQMVHHHMDPRGGAVRVEAGCGESRSRVRALGDWGEQTHSTENTRRNHRVGLGMRAGRNQMHQVAKKNG